MINAVQIVALRNHCKNTLVIIFILMNIDVDLYLFGTSGMISFKITNDFMQTIFLYKYIFLPNNLKSKILNNN